MSYIYIISVKANYLIKSQPTMLIYLSTLSICLHPLCGGDLLFWWCLLLLVAAPTRGRLFVFVRFSPMAASHGMAAASHPYFVTLISAKPLFRLIWCSTYWIQVLIPKLHQFFRKFEKIFGSSRPSLIFFYQIRTLSPWYLQNCFFDSLCV